MELLLPNPHLFRTSFFHTSPNPPSINDFTYRRRLYSKSKTKSILYNLPTSLKSVQNSTSNEYLYQDDGELSWGKDSDTVEVIGIGSRKDAILDFCLDSPFQSSFSSLRFWSIILNDSSPIQLQQRSSGKDGKDIVLRNMELPASQLSTPRAVILVWSKPKMFKPGGGVFPETASLLLGVGERSAYKPGFFLGIKVASAGYGLDHITAIELLGAVKSAQGLAVGIVLKPFSFEGQRRQEEVAELVTKLREHTNFSIVVDTDVLLKKEVVTLAEALRSANDAVLLSINSIFVLTSERFEKQYDYPHNERKQLKVPELLELMEFSKEARVGYGAGNDMKSSIARAVFDCPFIGDGLKDVNGVIFCTLACADVLENSNFPSFLRTFRNATGWQKEIVLSIVHEPNLEQNLFVTTFIVCGIKTENMQRNGFLSGLARSFPFVFSLLGRDRPGSNELQPAHSVEGHSLDDDDQSPNQYSDELQIVSDFNYDENHDVSEEEIEDEIPSASGNSIPDVYSQISEGELPFEREPLVWWNVGPSFHIAEEWAKERAAISGSNPVLNNQCIYKLPVGVKSSEQSQDSPKFPNMPSLKSRMSNDLNEVTPGNQNTPSWDTKTDTGFDAVLDIYNATSTILKGTQPSAPKKPGLLSMRAASMLEVERDSHNKWARTIEMQYQGGIYSGRCQGGLPEGKGRLTLGDGSIYDGMWRYGKRSGVGTFYYSNGDVFQGSWRDDLMHGKGWFYFHSGDRWFANFWKGKANGEGRFYSKDGEIFFGHFQDGWRHGHSLCIGVDGVRWAEIWDEGVLISRQQVDTS